MLPKFIPVPEREVELNPGEFPPPKILKPGTYKVIVERTKIISKETGTTILLALKEPDQNADITSWLNIFRNGEQDDIALGKLSRAFICFGEAIPVGEEISEELLSKLVGKMGKVKVKTKAAYQSRPPTNDVQLFLPPKKEEDDLAKDLGAVKEDVPSFLHDDD